MKIIVLSITKIGEKDALVNAISPEGYLTFKAHGVLSPTSKNALINNPLAIVDAILTNNKSGSKSLKECSLIFMPDFTSSNLTYLVAINTFLEATIKMLNDDEKHLAFPYLETCLMLLSSAKYPLFTLIAYLAKLIKLAGSSFEINQCVNCGSRKKIVAFSFVDGGYICENCYDESIDKDLSIYQLSLIRPLCGTKDFYFDNLEYKEGEVNILLKKFILFINDGIGVLLESPRLILKY